MSTLQEAQPTTTATPTSAKVVDAVVVGAGFAGMYMLHRLRELGFSVQVYEAGSDVGGTWYWNRYPGARCDVESLDYSYSFSTELEQEWEWTERYSPQPEILKYANHVADRFDLRRDIQFNTRVTSAVYDEATPALDGDHRPGRAGDRPSSSSWPSAACRAAKTPEVPGARGLPRASGTTPATGRTRASTSPASGSASIGTGSSAIQSIPMIAEQAAHLTVFQRTPNFSLPAKNRPLDPETSGTMKARYREYRQAARESGFGVPAADPERSALEVDPDERTETLPRTGFEAGQPRRHAAVVQRPHHRQGGQRHGRRVRPLPDPGDRQGPGGGRAAVARRTTRSAPSGPASTPATTPRSTVTT